MSIREIGLNIREIGLNFKIILLRHLRTFTIYLLYKGHQYPRKDICSSDRTLSVLPKPPNIVCSSDISELVLCLQKRLRVSSSWIPDLKNIIFLSSRYLISNQSEIKWQLQIIDLSIILRSKKNEHWELKNDQP